MRILAFADIAGPTTVLRGKLPSAAIPTPALIIRLRVRCPSIIASFFIGFLHAFPIGVDGITLPNLAPPTARLWEVFPNVEELVAQVKATAPRALTVAQRKSLFLDPEPPAWCI